MSEPSGRLALTLPADRYLYRRRTSRWADGKRWTLESRLGAVVIELWERAALDLAREEKAARELAEQQRQWDAAMAAASYAFLADQRLQALDEQVKQWQKAERIRAWCDHLAALRGSDPGVQEWVAWARTIADGLDPATRATAPVPRPPSPGPDVPGSGSICAGLGSRPSSVTGSRPCW